MKNEWDFICEIRTILKGNLVVKLKFNLLWFQQVVGIESKRLVSTY